MFPRLRLLAEYAPLLAYAQELAEHKDPHKRALIALDAVMWLAKRSDNDVDDKVVSLVKSVLATPEGQELFNYTVDGVKSLIEKATK